MTAHSNRLPELEDSMVQTGIELIEEYGAQGLFAIERALRRIKEHPQAPQVLAAEPSWIEPKADKTSAR